MLRIIRASTLRELREIEADWKAEHEPEVTETLAFFRELVESGRWAAPRTTRGADQWREAIARRRASFQPSPPPSGVHRT